MRYFVLGAAYLAQGSVHGLAAFVLIPTLAADGVSLGAQSGLLALGSVPWILKMFWAPALDLSRGVFGWGTERVIGLAMLGVAAGLVTLGLGLGSFAGVHWAVLWFLINLVLSLQDVATDAFAIDTVAPRDRGRANAVMLGGQHVGFEGLGGLAFGYIVVREDLRLALFVAGWIVAMLAVLPLFYRAAPLDRSVTAPSTHVVARTVLSPRGLIVLGVAFGALMADVLTSAVSGALLVNELGWSLDRIVVVLPVTLLVANLLGYGIATVCVDRTPHERGVVLGSFGLGIVWIVFAGLRSVWSEMALFVAIVGLQALASALLLASLQAWLMNRVDLRIRASHCAVIMAALNAPRVVIVPLAAPLLRVVGWGWFFAIAGLIQIGYGLVFRQVQRLLADERSGTIS